jgi:hypothetical protein
MLQNEPRMCYQIIRGSYSRREGDPVVVKDDRGNPIKKSRQFVCYSPKTVLNPSAKDEIMLTATEARAFGMHKLKGPLFGRGAATSPLAEPVSVSTRSEAEAETGSNIEQLIRDGQEATSVKKKREFRKAVIEADLLDEVPEDHDAILGALAELMPETV